MNSSCGIAAEGASLALLNKKVQEIRRVLSQDQNQLLDITEKLHQKLSDLGISCPSYSEASLKAIIHFSDSQKIQKLIKDFSDLIVLMSEVTPDPAEIDHVTEVFCLQKALKKNKMKAEDDFWDNYAEGDVVEVYGSDMIQRYRTFNFFRTTGYSLLDLAINEWYVLWERPKVYFDQLLQIGTEILQGARKASTVEVPAHVVNEVYNSGCTVPFKPASLMVKFKYIAPLFEESGNEIIGFVVTCTCEPLVKDPEADVT